MHAVSNLDASALRSFVHAGLVEASLAAPASDVLPDVPPEDVVLPLAPEELELDDSSSLHASTRPAEAAMANSREESFEQVMDKWMAGARRFWHLIFLTMTIDRQGARTTTATSRANRLASASPLAQAILGPSNCCQQGALPKLREQPLLVCP